MCRHALGGQPYRPAGPCESSSCGKIRSPFFITQLGPKPWLIDIRVWSVSSKTCDTDLARIPKKWQELGLCVSFVVTNRRGLLLFIHRHCLGLFLDARAYPSSTYSLLHTPRLPVPFLTELFSLFPKSFADDVAKPIYLDRSAVAVKVAPAGDPTMVKSETSISQVYGKLPPTKKAGNQSEDA